MAPTDCSIPIFHPFVLTAGGAQGPTTINVNELLRHKPGPDDVEEARKDETTQLQIILGSFCCDMRYAVNMAKAIGQSALHFLLFGFFSRYCCGFGFVLVE